MKLKLKKAIFFVNSFPEAIVHLVKNITAVTLQNFEAMR